MRRGDPEVARHPLLQAALGGDLGQIKRLVASGVPVDYTDEADGWAAAHAAASAGHLDVLRFLASKDADLTRATSPPGCFNIVHLAARAGHLNVLEWLEDRMPGVVRPLYSLRDGKGRIPADSSANGEVKRFFRRVGADSSIAAQGGGGAQQRGGKARHGQRQHGKAPAHHHKGTKGAGGGGRGARSRGERRRVNDDEDEEQHEVEEGHSRGAEGGAGAAEVPGGRPGGGVGRSKGGALGPRTVFRRETDDEVERGRADATRPLCYRYHGPPELLRCPDRIAESGSHLPMPVRPAWHAGMSAEEVQSGEERAFSAWLDGIYDHHDAKALNHFEHSLGVWQQLWRVVERSHVLLLLADSRCPALHVHESLLRHITRDAKKGVVLVLTKTDLVPAPQLHAWTHYYLSRFSGLVVVPFASATSRSAVIEGGRHEAALLLAGVRRCLQATYGEGLEGLPLSSVSWERGDGAEEGRRKKGGEVEEEEEQGGSEEGGDDQDEESEDNDDDDDDEEEDHEEEESVWAGRRRQAVVVGLVGEPNVGKSSLLNTLLGRKRVSVSATPGRTKHLQTHYYSRSVVLCDCPGVVFPRLGVERPLQVLMGQYPIAQVREPLAVVRYLAEHSYPRLHHAYRLRLPACHGSGDSPDHHHHRQEASNRGHDPPGPPHGGSGSEAREEEGWSPYLLAESLALQLGYHTKGRGGRADVARAANRMLRDALVGRGPGRGLVFYPPAEAVASGEAGEGGEEKKEQREA